jgi:uncharacterized membrane protein YwaF
MLWGSFGAIHIVSLVLAVAFHVGLHFLLKGRSKRIQTIVLGALSFSGIAAVVFNLVTWGSPLEYLPFHLCSLNAMALPFAVFTRNKTVSNLLLLWALGAVLALVLNQAQAEYEIFSATFAFYFFPHALEVGIPILLFSLGLVKKDCRCIISTVVITLVCYTAIHFINLGLNAYIEANQITDSSGALIRVNYMYSLAPENPVLVMMHNVLPLPYFYMFLGIPLIVLYLSVVYVKEFYALIRSKQKVA